LIEKIFTLKIFGYLDYESLRKAENVCVMWKKAIANGRLWEKLYGRNVSINNRPFKMILSSYLIKNLLIKSFVLISI